MKSLLLFISLAVAYSAIPQTTITFEDQTLDSESFINDAGTTGEFKFSEVSFPNDYNAEWGSFSDWAISNMTDTQTEGFGNQFSSITGGGENSENFGVCFVSGGSWIKFTETVLLEDVFITNGTYPYLSMLNGDAFAKQFGGESGNDPDYFKLTIKSYADGELNSDSIVVSLADYTFENNAEDFILDTWQNVDLSVLGVSDSLWFGLTSTDIGDFGMNTPSYFCLDNLTYSTIFSVSEEESKFSVYPNPVTDMLTFSENINELKAYDLTGALVLDLKTAELSNEISLTHLNSGIYTFQFFLNDSIISKKIIKE